jgi:hypothetical protein
VRRVNDTLGNSLPVEYSYEISLRVIVEMQLGLVNE